MSAMSVARRADAGMRGSAMPAHHAAGWGAEETHNEHHEDWLLP